MAFASLTIDLNARLANIERDLGKMAHQAEKESQRMQAAFAKAGAAATAMVGALGVGAWAAWINSSIDAADNLNDLSKKTGIAVENLAGLQLVVDKSGTTMEMLGGGVAKLNKTLGEAARGSKDAQTVLRDLGITATDPMEAFYQLADAFGRFRTEGDKADAMSKVIGKTWTELAPALAEGGDGLRAIVEEGKRLNPVTKEMAEQADKFNDAMSRFKTQASGVGTAIATSLLPAMNDMLTRWNDAISLSSRHGGFVGLVLGGINPTGTNSANLKAVRDEMAAIQLQLKDAGTVQGDIAGINGPRLRARLSELEAIKQTLLEIQRREALALNDQFGTGNYKQPSPPDRTKISLTPDGKTAKPKDRMSDTEWAMEESAHLTRTLFQIGEEMDKAREAAFDRADESAQAWQDSLDAANAQLSNAAAGYIDLIDPVEKYRRKLDEIAQLQEAGLLTKEQATEATFAINEQIDGLNQVNDTLREQKSIADELGLTFSSAFEDAVIGGKSFSEVLKGIEKDIARIIIRKSVTEPLGNAISGIFSGINWGSIFNFGGGKASGGAVYPGQYYVVGENGPEVLLPNTAGTVVPNNALGGGGGGGVTIIQHISVDSRSDRASILAAMSQAKDMAKAEILNSMQRGGTYARATGRA